MCVCVCICVCVCGYVCVSFTQSASHLPDFLGGLHGGQLHGDHAVGVGLAHEVGLGAEDVRRRHGRDAVLQPASAVAAVREQEGVLRLRLQLGDQLLREAAVHLRALPVVVQDLRREGWREEGREGWREEWREGWREEGMDRGMYGGREGGREGGMDGWI